jgi:Zn finger protein HypA/HybF involved in hydrogenase expression
MYKCLCCDFTWSEAAVVYGDGIPRCPNCGSEDLTQIQEENDER